jgi:hypothetical protein
MRESHTPGHRRPRRPSTAKCAPIRPACASDRSPRRYWKPTHCS